MTEYEKWRKDGGEPHYRMDIKAVEFNGGIGKERRTGVGIEKLWGGGLFSAWMN